MLDLSGIPVVDHHLHPILLEQRLEALPYRACFTEASDPVFAGRHVAHSLPYLWMLRQLGETLGCESRDEEKILKVRNALSADALTERLYRAAGFDLLIFDEAYPEPERCYAPERLGQ